MKNKKPLYLSICIPAFKRIEYLRRTLNSIYNEKNLAECNLEDFEVVISDNDKEKEIFILLQEFKFDNIRYFYTNCDGFMNSFHVLTYANGSFLKLHNSQELWNPGSLKIIIDIVKTKILKKPLIFFTGGLLMSGKIYNFYNYDNYMRKLSYLSSWSNGFCIWKSDFDNVKDFILPNNLFPHTSIFLTQHFKSEFIINDKIFFTTQFIKKRGGHNKFYAFSIEYPSLIDSCFRNGKIKLQTRNKILNDILLSYLPLLYFNVKIAKRETFDSVGFKQDVKKYFPKLSYYLIIFLSVIIPFKILYRKLVIKYILKSKF
jgi:hypothetical protein